MNDHMRFKNSFSEVTPPTNNETIVRNVIERANNMSEKKKLGISKRAVAVLAAAVVLVGAAVSVGAATNWSFNLSMGKAMEDIGSKYEAPAEVQTAEEEPEEQSGFDFLSTGKELDQWYSFDDYKLNIRGVCADEKVAYLLMDVVFDDDIDCAPKDGWTDWDIISVLDTVELYDEERPQIGGLVTIMSHGIISQEGNTVHLYVQAQLRSGASWSGQTMTVEIKDGPFRCIPTTSEKSEQPYLNMEQYEGGVSLEIPIDFPLYESKVYTFDESLDLSSVELNRIYYGEGLTGMLKYVKVSPFSWEVMVEADTSMFLKSECYDFDITFSTDSGTVRTPAGYGSMDVADGSQTDSGLFTPAVAPDEIRSVTVCGREFALK